MTVVPSSKFEQMPYDCMLKCWDFLDDKTAISTAVLSKSQSTPSLKNKRDAIILALRNDILFCRAEGYPERLVQAFRQSNRKIHQLPVLDISGHTGRTGYIDFVRPKHMSHPVMRFKDITGRPGIVFNLQDIPGKADPKFANPKGTMALFQRSPGSPGFFAAGYDRSDLEVLIEIEHRTHNESQQMEDGQYVRKDNCPSCLNNIVKGSGLTFKHAATQKKVELLGIAPPVNHSHVGAYTPHVAAYAPFVAAPRNQASITNKVIIVTSLAIIALAFMVRYCFQSDRS